MVDLVQAAIGGILVAAPGLLLTRALAPQLDWAKTVAASVVVSMTIPPATMYILNLFLGVPVTMMNAVFVFLLWATIGLALWAQPHLKRSLPA